MNEINNSLSISAQSSAGMKEELNDEFIDDTHDLLLQTLVSYGNTYTDKEMSKLRSLIELMCYVAQNDDRQAIPFPTAFGKSTSLQAFITSLSKHNIESVGVTVCLSSINEIEDFVKGLESMGCDMEKVATTHTRSERSGIKCFTNDLEVLETKQFILMTQQRIEASAGKEYSIAPLLFWMSNARLMLWDESLRTMKGSYIEERVLFDGIETLRGRYMRYPKERNVHIGMLMDYVSRVELIIETGKPTDMPSISEEFDIDEVRSFISSDSVTENSLSNTIIKLISFSGSHVSIAPDKDDSSNLVVRFQKRIPDSMARVVVLDASVTLDKFAEYDKSLKVRRDLEVVRSYAGCKIIWVEANSSKSGLKDDETRDDQIGAINFVFKERIEVLADQRVLAVTHKADKKNRFDLVEHLSTGFPNLSIKDDGDQEIGCNILTWGQERSTNRFSDVTVGFNLGLLYLPVEHIKATLMAQSRNHSFIPTRDEINKAQHANQLTMLSQLIARMSREFHEGRISEPWTFVLIDKNAKALAEELIDRNFRGAECKSAGLSMALAIKMHSAADQFEHVKRVVDMIMMKNGKGAVSMTEIRKQARINSLATDSSKWKGTEEYAKPYAERQKILEGRRFAGKKVKLNGKRGLRHMIEMHMLKNGYEVQGRGFIKKNTEIVTPSPHTQTLQQYSLHQGGIN